MKGSIYTDRKCPVCGIRLKSLEPRGFFCPKHPRELHDGKCRIVFDNVTTRCENYREAYKILTRKRAEVDSGTYDVRDYKIKAKPLSIAYLGQEWLRLKKTQVRPSSMPQLNNAIRRATNAWGEANIKSIKYAQVEDLFISLNDLAPKTRSNMLAALRQFCQWASDRYEIPPLKKWPKLSTPEMKFRKTVSIHDQEAILEEVYKIAAPTRIRSWIGIKWLCTYISVRPGEMLSLKEGNIDRTRGLLIFPHPKERKPKVVALLDEDKKLLEYLPLAFPEKPFFRHEHNAETKVAGKKFGPNRFYRDWKEACDRLGFKGVDLYGGTKHSTAMGLRDVATFEEVRKMTGHTTNKAFDRYLQLEGETMKNLYARRKSIADKNLTRNFSEIDFSKVLIFKG